MSDPIQTVYEQWHEFASARNIDALINIYVENAIFESPLVPVILNGTSGVLYEKAAIHHFLEEGTRRRPNDLVHWYREGKYFSDGQSLIWDYPRQVPEANKQIF